jgi:hypothetical protein
LQAPNDRCLQDLWGGVARTSPKSRLKALKPQVFEFVVKRLIELDGMAEIETDHTNLHHTSW